MSLPSRFVWAWDRLAWAIQARRDWSGGLLQQLVADVVRLSPVVLQRESRHPGVEDISLHDAVSGLPASEEDRPAALDGLDLVPARILAASFRRRMHGDELGDELFPVLGVLFCQFAFHLHLSFASLLLSLLTLFI